MPKVSNGYRMQPRGHREARASIIGGATGPVPLSLVNDLKRMATVALEAELLRSPQETLAFASRSKVQASLRALRGSPSFLVNCQDKLRRRGHTQCVVHNCSEHLPN